jgi:DNA polymerase Ligase (LigD)
MPEKSAAMLRFVILAHDHPILHWDFMLENEAALRTWRLAERPAAGRAIDAELIAMHRLAYLDYEGPVGENRGTIRALDRGTYVLTEESADLVVAELSGSCLTGQVTLRRRNDSSGWTFLFSDRGQG